VLVLSLDNLHELLIKQPHPTDYLILEWLNMVMISWRQKPQLKRLFINEALSSL
jgi:hypothetical protein